MGSITKAFSVHIMTDQSVQTSGTYYTQMLHLKDLDGGALQIECDATISGSIVPQWSSHPSPSTGSDDIHWYNDTTSSTSIGTVLTTGSGVAMAQFSGVQARFGRFKITTGKVSGTTHINCWWNAKGDKG